MIPFAGRGPIQVNVLSGKYNAEYLPANGEVPVKQKWFRGGDVTEVRINPHIAREATVNPVETPRPKELNVARFFGRG